MIDRFVVPSASYVMADPFFWPAMCFTVMIGIFIGSLIYDGVLKEVRKGVVTLFSYSFMVISVNASRIVPQLFDGTVITSPQKPLAGLWTIIFVTIFYLIGMFLGVLITNYAHHGKASIIES